MARAIGMVRPARSHPAAIEPSAIEPCAIEPCAIEQLRHHWGSSMSIPPTQVSVRGRWQGYLAGLPDFQARLFMTATGAGLESGPGGTTAMLTFLLARR